MPDLEKIKQLEELFDYDKLFNYDGNEIPTFDISKVLGKPMWFFSDCFNFDSPEMVDFYFNLTSQDSEKYDSRFESTDKETMLQFLKDYIDYIDIDRLTLAAYKRIEEFELDEASYEKILFKENSLKMLKALIRKNYKHSYLYTYKPIERSADGLPHLESIYADEILGKKSTRKENNILPKELYAKYMKYLRYDTLPYLNNDTKMYAALNRFFSDLYDSYPNFSDQDRVKVLMNDKVFKQNINPELYLSTLDYGMVEYLQNNSQTITLDEFVSTVEDFNTANLGIDLSEYYDRDYRDEFANRNLIAEYDDICLELSNKFLSQDGSNIDRFVKLGLINRDQLEKYLSDSVDKETTLGTAFALGLVDRDQLGGICDKYKLDIQSVKNKAFNCFIERKAIKKSDYLKYPIKIPEFRTAIPSTELPKLTTVLIKNATSEIKKAKAKAKNEDYDLPLSSTNLFLLLEDGIIDESFIKTLYLNNELSKEDIDTVSEIYKVYGIDSLYGFEQSTKQLATFYKFTYDDLISQALEAEGDIYEDKPIFPDPDEHLIKQNYEFQRKMFIDSPKNRATKYSELEAEFDYLILYKGIAKHLYLQGLIDFKKLKEQIDDKGQLPENREITKMILNGEIRKEDLPEAVRDTSLEDNPLVLTLLYDSKNITYLNIVDKYLDGKVSYDTLMRFAEGRTDFSTAFNGDRYLGLFSNAIKSAKEDKIKFFARYKRAFEEFKPKEKYENIYRKIYAAQKKELEKSGNVDKFSELYRKNVIDGKNLLDLLESTNIKSSRRILDTIADLILTQDLSIQDCELLFRDTDDSQNKRKRLEFILSTYDIPDEIKMKTLLDCYIGNTKTDLENYNYLLNACFPKATPDAPRENDEGTRHREEGGGAGKPEQELMPYPARYREIIAMDPTMTSRIIGSKMIFHSRRYNKHLFEQIYTTKKNVNTDLTTHATYIVSDELVDEIQDELFERDEHGNIVDFDYGVLIDNYRQGDRTQISKTLHKSRTWATKTQEKLTRGHELAEAVLELEDDDMDIV